jgi:hypothetical protein
VEVVNAVVGASFTLGVALSNPGRAALEANYTYKELKSEINDLFNEMQAQLVESHTEIVNDYGLMTAVGEISQVGLLPPTNGEAGIRIKARMVQASVIQLWQAVTPETWVIYRTGNQTNAMRDVCGDVFNSDGNCWNSGDGHFWGLSWNRAASPRICPVLEVTRPCKSIEASDKLFKTLFNQPNGSFSEGTGCYQAWTQSCNLGVSFPDVFRGQNGWDLPVRKCSDTNISYRCPLDD